MNERILRVLEYNKVIQQLIEQAETSLGKDLTAQLTPSSEFTEVEHLQEETDEAAKVIRLNKAVPLGGVFDVRASLKRSAIGGVLKAEECLDVASTIYGGLQAKIFIESLEEPLPILEGLAEHIEPLTDLKRHIEGCIDDHGKIMDSASEKLRGIRSSIRTFESSVREKLDHYTKTKSNMLSDAIVTIRNERYVLPVKQEHRASIGGIVHDQSASGATLFMEPKAVVEINNQLQEAALKENQEMERILRELSKRIAENEIAIYENMKVLGKIDFMFARAKLGAQMKASRPKINNHGFIKMQQTRHPLIPRNEVVANDVEIGDTYTTILITGPNTGGKTVTLKMIGLCVLMAQSGLQIPAQDGCETAVFEHVFADIGDEQSIEQNLSTFSSHMTNIVQILEEVDNKSLVLFDELGAGTDPQEGAALAMSILDEVMTRDARVIATTHYPELKAYGFNRENVINASVEFDVKTLEPTYRLLIGVPGRSNAFDISKRLGLADTIIDKAKNLTGADSESVENMIASLDSSRKQAEQEYEEAHQILMESENLKASLQKEWKQFEQKRETLYKRAEEKAEKALQNAREEAEMIVAEIRKMKNGASMKEHEWIEAKKMLEEANPKLSTDTGQDRNKQKVSSEELKPGDDIKLLTADQQGTVLEKISDKAYLVQVGIMKVKAKRKDLQRIKKQPESAEKPIATIRGANSHVRTELDLRGERYEDALFKVEKYLDDALLAGYQQVSIIHGKGTGALRKGIQEFAKRNPRIASHRPGESGEGGSGVTVLKLR